MLDISSEIIEWLTLPPNNCAPKQTKKGKKGKQSKKITDLSENMDILGAETLALREELSTLLGL